MRLLAPLVFALVVGAPQSSPSPSLPSPLAPVERAIVDHVETHSDEALALLERVVDINSGTLNLRGVREVGRIFEARLSGVGFDTRWLDGAPFGRAGHMVAQRNGDGPHVLLIGHLDTVFEADSPFQKFERVSPTAARGPGTTDMKGGNVILVYALEALRAVGVLDGLRLTVVLTGDEEKTGRPLSLSRQVLTEIDADAAIGFEDGDSNPETAVIARRGSTSWQLRATGVPAHSSQVFTDDVGAGAIYEVARILHEFYARLSKEPNLTFSPGVILGGTDVELDATHGRGTAFGKNNVVAEHAVAGGDLRALSPEQYDRARETMLSIVAEHLPRTEAELTFDEGYPPLAPTDGNRRLLELYSAVSVDLGFGPVSAVDPRKAGAADVSFVAGRVPMILDGIGLMGSGGHTVDEVADLTTLPMQTERAALLIYRLSRELRADRAEPGGPK